MVRTLGIAFAALMLLALPLVFAPKAHAADFFDFGYGDYYDFGGYDYGYGDYYPSYDYGYGDYYPSYDYGYGDYYSDYSSGYGSGFGSSFGSGSSWFPMGGSSWFPMGGSSMPSVTNVNQNQNQNTCTTGSCNTNINAPTTVSTISYPQPTYQQPIVYQQPSYPVYQPNYYPQQPVYPTYQQPRAPYVSLSAVPYTGLELGPVGTALYWGFLVLWCLIAAYLIAVKKVHYKIAAWFAGSKAATASTHAPVRYSEPKVETKVNRVPQSQLAGIDPFIASQINR